MEQAPITYKLFEIEAILRQIHGFAVIPERAYNPHRAAEVPR